MAEPQDESPRCDYCKQTYSNLSALYRHLRVQAAKPDARRNGHPGLDMAEYKSMAQSKKWWKKSKDATEQAERKSDANARYRSKEPERRTKRAEEYFKKLR
jgi:hypothetical protein